MNLTREQTIKALETCLYDDLESCKSCPLDREADCRSILRKAYYEHLKELEPAPAGTETSPEVSTRDTNNLTYLDDTTFARICQAFDFAERAANTILDIYNAAMSESEQRAFDLGESYRDMINAKCELEELKAGEPE